MRNEGPVDWGRVPARVLLRGGPGGWHYVVVDDKGAERRTAFDGPGTLWQTGGRSDPEPPWWRRRLAETAEGLRAVIAEHYFPFVRKVRIVPSGLSSEGPLIGAAALIHRAHLLP